MIGVLLIDKFLGLDFEDLGKEGLEALKLQFLLLGVLFLGFLEVFLEIPLYPVIILIALAYFYVLFKAWRDQFEEKHYFVGFFGALMLIVLVSIYSVKLFPKGFFNPTSTALLFGAIFLLLLLLKNLVTTQKVNATILLSNESLAVVRISFSLKAGITAGKYVVKASKKYEPGEKVKVALRKGILSKKPYSVE